jgi:hypothetical protein
VFARSAQSRNLAVSLGDSWPKVTRRICAAVSWIAIRAERRALWSHEAACHRSSTEKKPGSPELEGISKQIRQLVSNNDLD